MSKATPSIEDLGADAANQPDEESAQGKFKKKMAEMGVKELEESTAGLATSWGYNYIDLVGFPIAPESISMIDEEEAKQLKTVCFFRDNFNIRLASTDPKNEAVAKKLKELQDKFYFQNGDIYLVSPRSLEYGMKFYRTLPKITEYKEGVEITAEDLERFEAEIEGLASIDEKINRVNITDVITLVIATSLKLNSSDIHVEAGEGGVAVRFRIDGVLQTGATIDSKRWSEVVARLKILARAKINITDRPQDGRFTIKLTDKKIDVRVSFLPTAYGESVVMRLLESDATGLELENMGMLPQALNLLTKEIAKPNGLILTTGPTGSGKTTTLYAALKRINKPGTKIITLEDPIEYHLPNINQSQVDEKKGYTFAKALRSVLRQDPDIIMIGEIRDLETAEIAIQSALTGHLVLSTLHTNDSAGVIPRLLDLGIKPFLLTPAINGIMAQRLVRQLCSECRVAQTLSEAETEQVKKILAVISPKAGIDIPSALPTFYQPGDNKSCPKCGGVGYKGRVGIFEIFTMSDNLKALVAENVPAFKILEAAIEDGMITMLQDGVLKAMAGTTSLEEVYKVIGKTDYVDALYDIVTSKTIGRGLKLTEDNLKVGGEIAKNFIGSGDLIKNYKTSEMINILIAAAIKIEAGDLHIDPEENNVRIRFRIDGILHDVATLGKEYYVPLIGEIKDLAGFDTKVKKATYDGRFAIYVPNDRYDCRVSIITGGYGETAVLRVLTKQPATVKIEELGLQFKTKEVVLEAVTKTRGIIINTGPTGSGKTTTLYSILSRLNKSDIKIITVEDPIEYSLEGIMQTQADEKTGYGFANALRSLMRQNPNIIMIGEVRDAETAKTAIEAALTGHLVLSTVHANSAAGAITRFYELGIERTILAGAMECSIGQRLARRVCPHCQEEYQPEATVLKQVEKILAGISTTSGAIIPKKLVFVRGKGCEQCGGIGYKGRVGLFEAISITGDIKKAIQEPTTIDEDLEKLARTQGFVSVLEDGILKALDGETTVEEVLRVAK
jgi:type II secretory ATPase GspE/PulE/Tfp pilus assembly ATPase PilB-like protein